MRTYNRPFLAGMLIVLIGLTAITSARAAASDYVGVTKNSFFFYYVSMKFADTPENDTTQFIYLTVDSIEDFSTSTNVTYSIQILFDSDVEQPDLMHVVIDHEIPDPINLDPLDTWDWFSLLLLSVMISTYSSYGGWIMNKQQLPKELKLENATSGELVSIKYDDNGVLESLNLVLPESTAMTEIRILRLNLYLYIGGGVIGVVILIVIIAVCAKRKR